MNWTELKAEAKKLHTHLSTYVVAAASAAAAYWLQLAPAEQAALLAAWPNLSKALPYISAAAWAVARAWPQGKKD